MNKINQVNTLLKLVGVIKNSYDKVSNITGEKFNIFSILQIERNEVTTHSRFIAELLNPHGIHGFGGIFLELFINQIDNNFILNTKICKVQVEAYQGSVTTTTGGTIDILIQEQKHNGKTLVIENKIDAEEQYNQLLRYQNAFPEAKLIFLTLEGRKSNQNNNVKYTCMSYSEDIINWLENCRKEAVNIPIVRESITQYLNLIKKITYQNTNTSMNKDIINTIITNEENFDAFNTLLQSSHVIKNEVIKKTIQPIIQKIANDNGVKVELNLDKNWPSFSFSGEIFEEKGVNLVFSSSVAKGIINIVFGFLPQNRESNKSKPFEKKLDETFSSTFERVRKGYEHWITLSYFYPYQNWDDFETLKKIQFHQENFEKELNQILSKSLTIVKKL